MIHYLGYLLSIELCLLHTLPPPESSPHPSLRSLNILGNHPREISRRRSRWSLLLSGTGLSAARSVLRSAAAIISIAPSIPALAARLPGCIGDLSPPLPSLRWPRVAVKYLYISGGMYFGPRTLTLPRGGDGPRAPNLELMNVRSHHPSCHVLSYSWTVTLEDDAATVVNSAYTFA